MTQRVTRVLWIPALALVHGGAIFWFVGLTCGTFGSLANAPERGSPQGGLCADGLGSGALDPLPYALLFGSLIVSGAVVTRRAVQDRPVGARLGWLMVLAPVVVVMVLSLPADTV